MNANLKPARYIGRFAPSPTGPLHFGSLVAATASYLDAKAHHGQWLVRMENVDKSREQPGAATDILQTLEAFGFEWQREICFQSQRDPAYSDAINTLQQKQQVYPCSCSRKQIQQAAKPGIEGFIYPGFCRDGLSSEQIRSWRLRVSTRVIEFTDRIQGDQQQLLANAVGDFVLKRADGYYAYQLAVVVDDAMQGITHVVRGADLLDSTPRQIFLQQQLGMRTPNYAHVPVATYANGDKLSKQTRAQPVNPAKTSTVLVQVLYFLGLKPPADLATASATAVWQWAEQHWQVDKIPPTRQQVCLFPTAVK